MYQHMTLTLSRTLTLTGGQHFSGAIVWLLPIPKTFPNLDPNPNPNRGQFSFGAIVRTPLFQILKERYCRTFAPLNWLEIHKKFAENTKIIERKHVS